MVVYWEEVTQEVLDLAGEIIAAHHPHLEDAKVGFVFRSEASKSGDKIVLGQAAKVSAKLRPHLDLDFIIWLAEDEWQHLEPIQKRALVDHELCHCDWHDGRPRMRHHDVEEFYVILIRYGLWTDNLKRAKSVFETAVQGELPLGMKRGEVVRVQPRQMALHPLPQKAEVADG